MIEDMHNLHEHIECYLEFDEIHWHVMRHLDETKDEVEHRTDVLGAILNLVNSLPNQTMCQLGITKRIVVTMDAEGWTTTLHS